jgi:hypothetical protein
VVFNTAPEPAPLRAGSSSTGSSAGSTDVVGNGVQSVLRLVANGNTTVWPLPPLQYAAPPVPMTITTVDIPRQATAGGRLELSCNQPQGIEGNGRTCQISEVWLVPAQGSGT